jgi:hypothetical protein
MKNEQVGFQNYGAGQLWAAVAHTNHGEIPGKAKGNECWYPYGGQEVSTNNFSYVVARNFRLVKSSFPPPGALQTGFQNDGAGQLWASVAHTNHGDIPGKAKGNECWYAYGGKEHSTNNFSWVVNAWDLVRGGGVPQDGVKAGRQNDGAGDLWCAVAHSNWGEIPGKAKGNECWFAYGGKEHSTNNFSWVIARGWRLERNNRPPQNGLPVGFQNDGAGQLWAAVAHSNWGDIPGKAKDNTCWFPYGGQEHSTNNFSWIVV